MNESQQPSPPSPPAPDRVEGARIAYAQMKSCRVLAVVFLLCGGFVFARTYDKYIAPDVVGALRDFSTMTMVLVPFIPSLILTFFARKAEKRYLELIKPE